MENRSKEFEQTVYRYYKNSCLRCGRWKLLTLHEIVPRSHFGKSENPFTIKNCVPLCEVCHDWAHRVGTMVSIPELTQKQKTWEQINGQY